MVRAVLATVVAAAVAAALSAGPASAALRQYFISAETGQWDYGPGGRNRLNNRAFNDNQVGAGIGLPMGSREFMHQPFLWMTPMQCTNSCDTNPGRVGGVYTKVRLIEYTDATFSTPVNVTMDEMHRGFLGPTLRASVGDSLEIVFRNNVQSAFFTGWDGPALSLHPHGVFYDRNSEGAPYLNNYTSISNPSYAAFLDSLDETAPQDAAARRAAFDASPAPSAEEMAAHYLKGLKEGASAPSGGADAEELAGNNPHAHGRRAGVHPSTGPGSSVASGETYTYRWEVPERAGPGPNDGSSVAWFYHSHVDEPGDTNAAAIGSIVVTDPARADPETAKPTDVDREITVIFGVTDENVSPLILHNSLNVAFGGNAMWFSAMGQMMGGSKNPMFIQGNLMHNINGRSYGTLDGVYMHKGERVRWYLGSLGNERDVHGAHWHANTLLFNGNRVDSIPLIPAVFVAADMTPDNVGVWQFHCHTNHHVHGGMTGLYEVLPEIPAGSSSAPSTSDSTDDDSSSDEFVVNQVATIGLILLGVFLVVVAALLCTAAQKEKEDDKSAHKASKASGSDTA